MRRDVFQALADPVRREILETISTECISTNEILENFEISKQAIVKQLNILIECGLVISSKQGKERYYSVEPTSMIPAYMWIENLQSQWEGRIDSFEEYIDKLKKKNNDKRK